MNPATALIAPSGPRSFEPEHKVMPTMLGPGMNWQKVRISAKSWIIHPAPLIDDDAAHPDERAAESEERHLEEAEKQRAPA